jgi:putative redox protein
MGVFLIVATGRRRDPFPGGGGRGPKSLRPVTVAPAINTPAGMYSESEYESSGSMDMTQTQAAAQPTGAGDAPAMEVRFVAGESYEVTVRGHRLVVDQPAEAGGQDAAPTPTELFVASLASCVAFYAGRYLTRHGYSRDGLAVSAAYNLATDRPARVSGIRMTVRVPASLPPGRRAALRAVASHCTVHNSLAVPPPVTIDLR